MRVFALSDIHVDYNVNAQWVAGLSATDYRNDVLILAGDVTDSRKLLEWCLTALANKFAKVLFVPGNHDLWVLRDERGKDSLQKFEEVRALVAESGASMEPFHAKGVSILPLLSWYDYSFGQPSEELKGMWMDYRACRWPHGYAEKEITAHFASLNDERITTNGAKVITYSHFMPRMDLLPGFIPNAGRVLFPVLGSTEIERQLRALRSSLHVYGHSHVNQRVTIDGVTYVNNAFGYPNETRITSKQLVSIHQS
jgi:predicted phosphodiesterase